MTELDVETRVRDIVAKYIDIPPEEINRESDLQELNIESLDLIEIIFEIEEDFGVDIEQDEKSANLTTVGQMLDWLTTNVDAQKTA